MHHIHTYYGNGCSGMAFICFFVRFFLRMSVQKTMRNSIYLRSSTSRFHQHIFLGEPSICRYSSRCVMQILQKCEESTNTWEFHGQLQFNYFLNCEISFKKMTFRRSGIGIQVLKLLASTGRKVPQQKKSNEHVIVALMALTLLMLYTHVITSSLMLYSIIPRPKNCMPCHSFKIWRNIFWTNIKCVKHGDLFNMWILQGWCQLVP